MVTDLMDQNVPHKTFHCLASLRPIIEQRTSIEKYHIHVR